MNSELVQSTDNRATVHVSLEPKEVNRIFHDVYNYYSQKLKIPGFRKGKIPPKIILSRVGEEEIREQVRDNIKAQAVQKSVDELKLDIRSQKVEFTDEPLPSEDQPYELSYEVPLLPEITLPDYKGFRIPLKRVEANEEMLASYRSRLLDRFIEYDDKDAPAELGDAIVYDLKTTFDDGAREAPLRHEGALHVLGREDNLPGYDEHFVGATAGTKLTFEYAMPNNFAQRQVAGKTLIFEVSVNKVQTVKKPEVTAEFVKEHFKMDSLEEFARYLRDTLGYELSEEEKRYKEEVSLSHLLGRMAVNLSEDMISEETDYLVSSQERRLRAAGHSMDELLKRRNQSLAEYRQSLREEAARRLKEFLAVRALARAEDLKVTDEELSRHAALMMRQYQIKADDMKKLLKNREFLNDAMMEILRAKAFKHIAASAQFYYEDEESPPAPDDEAAAEAASPRPTAEVESGESDSEQLPRSIDDE